MSAASESRRRLIIVSNRLPFKVTTRDGTLEFRESAGGLVSGLSGYVDNLRAGPGGSGSYLWVGWPGSDVDDSLKPNLRAEAMRFFRSFPVFLSTEEMEQFYLGFCNKTIWPLFHYFPTLVEYSKEYWDQYRQVNARFAEALAEIVQPDDIVWIHDYQLMLLPRLLRERVPDAAIGFFLHIPFPSFEVFRLLPVRWRDEILEGILGSDLVGFHTYEYAQHFLQSVLRIRGYDHNMGQIISPDRVIKVDTFPLGIDFDRLSGALGAPEVQKEQSVIRKSLAGVRVVLSVDRLDYTKGIINRLQGFEILLEEHPEFREKVALVMIVVPSRIEVDQYANMKKQIEEMVGSINGRYGRVGWTPVVYQYKQLSFENLLALYTLSDVCLVTPLRDGMNLVAKEYIASRSDERGVLILSEMAGAVKELGEAIVVNPNNREEIAEAMHEALTTPPAEQQRSLRTMRERLKHYTARRWAEDFVAGLSGMREVQARFNAKVLDAPARRDVLARAEGSTKRLLFLDYDGTLVPLERRPELARPSNALLRLLGTLAEDKANTIVVISGRDRKTLEAWLGTLPVSLVAEHGVWIRHEGARWKMLKSFSSEWKEHLKPILHHYTDRVPGSFVEEKEHSLVWHYRRADPDQARSTASELADNLMTFTANVDVHVLRGNKVVEVRNAGVTKGSAVGEWISGNGFDFILAAGDDWTDEDLFKSLPRTAISIRVGVTQTGASYNVRDQKEIIDLLTDLATMSIRRGKVGQRQVKAGPPE